MATGALDANGIWIYGEDDSEATFSALLNKLGTSTSDTVTRLEGFTGYTGTLPVANGGTGGTTVLAAQNSLRVGLVPISPSSVTAVGGSATASVATMGEVLFNCTEIQVNGVFSSEYRNYRLVISDLSATNNCGFYIRYKTASTTTTTQYYYQGFRAGTTLVYSGAGNVGADYIGSIFQVNQYGGTIDILQPNNAGRTRSVSSFVGYESSQNSLATWGLGHMQADNTAFTGFNLLVDAGQTMSGRVQVYGYND